MRFQLPGYRWGGAAAASVVADYADVKMKPLSSRLTNSELVAAVLLAMDAFNFGISSNPNYATAERAAADWGAGSLASGIYRRQLIASAPAATTTSSSNSGGSSTGVPAASSSAAAEIGIPF